MGLKEERSWFSVWGFSMETSNFGLNGCPRVSKIKLFDRKKIDFKNVFIPLSLGRFNSNSLQEAKGQKLLLGAALMKWFLLNIAKLIN